MIGGVARVGYIWIAKLNGNVRLGFNQRVSQVLGRNQRVSLGPAPEPTKTPSENSVRARHGHQTE